MAKKLVYLVVHCTATPEGRAVSAAELRRLHTSPPPVGRGWRQVGYADMVHPDGTIENLVPYNHDDTVDPWEITNGAVGINTISRHVVYVGGTDRQGRPKDTRTPPQRAALASYVLDTLLRHPHLLVAGHNQFAGKACPSFDTVQWLRSIGIGEANIYNPHKR